MPMTTEDDPARSLENVWRDILTRHGVSEAQAEDIVKLTFGTPALTRDIPDIDDVPDIVTESLAETGFEAHLDDDADPGKVRRELELALEDALRGMLSGPASVSDATLEQPFGPGTGPEKTDISASPSTVVGQPDTGAAWKSAGVDRGAESELDEDDIDALADALEAIQEKHGLETADLYAALERLEERQNE
ncbi:hypothetical protein [Haloarchaeobius sp. DYHT-AS-18]|uniref:hypothetical protein n=1 Tax=Haloarchaeobius sp. DYHT-AS-18 TaxID=3446117 RepID=UPI003EBC9167